MMTKQEEDPQDVFEILDWQVFKVQVGEGK